MSEHVLDPVGAARTAGRPQGFLLMFMSCLPILGAVLLAPVLPAMQDHFGDTGAAKALVPLSLTVPALMIAVLAPFAGRIVDRFGRKQLLIGALLMYAAFGTAPLWLDTLPAIVLSRAGVGIAEAAIMTCCTTLIADYFSGTERDRWFGLQTVFTSVSATIFFAVGGALGAHDWRTPFWLYASSLIFALLAVVMIRRPSGERIGIDRRTRAPLPPLPARALALPCSVTVFGGIVFYTPIVELPYVLDGAGITAVPVIGAFAALASLATAIGAYTFGRVSGRGTAFLLPLAFGLAGIGLILLGATSVVAVVVLGAVLASGGAGLMLPTMLVWAQSGLTFEQRGRGTGLWTAALFLGEFICPLLIVAITAAVGGLGISVALVGVVALALAALTRRALTERTPASA